MTTRVDHQRFADVMRYRRLFYADAFRVMRRAHRHAPRVYFMSALRYDV